MVCFRRHGSQGCCPLHWAAVSPAPGLLHVTLRAYLCLLDSARVTSCCHAHWLLIVRCRRVRALWVAVRRLGRRLLAVLGNDDEHGVLLTRDSAAGRARKFAVWLSRHRRFRSRAIGGRCCQVCMRTKLCRFNRLPLDVRRLTFDVSRQGSTQGPCSKVSRAWHVAWVQRARTSVGRNGASQRCFILYYVAALVQNSSPLSPPRNSRAREPFRRPPSAGTGPGSPAHTRVFVQRRAHDALAFRGATRLTTC